MAIAGRQAAPGKLQKMEIDLVEMTFHVEGAAPYLANRLDADRVQKGWMDGKTIAEIVDYCRYKLNPERDGCTDGIPTGAFMQAMINGARHTKAKMTELRGSFVIAQCDSLVPIQAPEPTVRADVGRNPNARSAAVVIHRPQYWPWAADIPIRFDLGRYTTQDIANMLQVAGMAIGVGDARPEKCALAMGRFDVISVIDERRILLGGEMTQ